MMARQAQAQLKATQDSRFRALDRTVAGMTFVVGAMLAAVNPVSAQIACRYEITAVLQQPSCGIVSGTTRATAISPNGQIVVGYAGCALGAPSPFKWTQAGGFQFVPLPPWLDEAFPADVSDAGLMVGTGNNPTAGQRGWVCDLNTGVWTQMLPQNSVGWSGASGITNDGRICGFRSIDDGGDPTTPRTAFVWSSKSGFTDLGLVDNRSTSAIDIAYDGSIAVSVGAGFSAYVWQDSTLISLGTIGNDGMYPIAIGVGGHVVGASTYTSGAMVAFDWSGTQLIMLPPLSATLNTCRAIDTTDQRVVVGSCSAGPGLGSPCIWWGAQVIDLASRVTNVQNIMLHDAIAISSDGRIVCNAISPIGVVCSVILSPLPNLPGDVNCDSRVNHVDLIAVIVAWGMTESPADLNRDGVVNVGDLLTVIVNWMAGY